MESISSIFCNIAIPVFIAIGGIWAFFKFRKTYGEAALYVRIENLELKYITDSQESFLYFQVLIKNLGKRDVDLLYPTAKISLTKTNLKPDISNDVEIEKKEGLTSKIQYPPTGRLRSGVSLRMPYLLKIKDTGLYFIEFEIKVDMVRYFKTKENREVPWTDRVFYLVEKDKLL